MTQNTNSDQPLEGEGTGGVTPSPTDGSGATQAEATTTSRKRGLFTPRNIIAALLAIALIVALSLYFFKDDVLGPADAKPIPEGALLVVPDNVDGGKANEDYNMGEAVEDDTAPTYKEPENIADYRLVDEEDGQVYFKTPIDGPCARSTSGGILPPDNYMHSCYYEQNGSVFYTSHAVIGPRTGALENIQFLKVGQAVTLDGVEYEVTSVQAFPRDKLPNYLFEPGVIGLVTCHLDASVKEYDDYTKTDVVLLKEK